MGEDSDNHVFSLMESVESGRSVIPGAVNDELLMGDEDADRSVASVEDQLHKEMTIYEVFNVRSFSYAKSSLFNLHRYSRSLSGIPKAFFGKIHPMVIIIYGYHLLQLLISCGKWLKTCSW